MKRVLYTIGAFVVAALALSACQKQEVSLPENNLITVTFSAEKAGLDTKTAAVEGENEVTFVWTDEDVSNIKLFSIGEDAEGKETLTAVANPTITKVSDTKLTISAKVAPNATYSFRAVLSGKWTNDGKKPRLSEDQTPSATNFDPSADVLISDDMEVTVGAAEEGEENVATSALEMVFRRPVVVNKMTLKNLTAGEAIDKVVISSDKEIAGYFNTDSRSASGDKKIITLKYNKAVTVPEGGQFPVFFTTIPGTGHSLTVEVTTDQNVYTKSFAEGKSIDFILGQFTKFNLALPEGVANTALSLPIEDLMAWAVSEDGKDGTAALNVADIPVIKDEKKVYSEVAYVYKGIDGLKMGTGSYRGVLTTSELDLSSAYYISVSARAWLNSSNTADVSQVEFLVDGESVYKSENLSSEYKTYFFNAPAATDASKITVKIDGKRGYIKDLEIKSGAIAVPPVINVSSANPMSVSNTAGTGIIEYTISNPTSATLTAALKDNLVTWISNLDCSTTGKVTFNVAAQETGAAARSAVIVLSYTDAEDVEVTVNQAKGAVGSISVDNWSYTFTSNPWGGTTGDADLVSGETTINWSLNAGYAAYNSNLLALSTGSVKANATIASNDVISNVSKVVVNAKTNSNCNVTLTVKVGETTLGTESLTNVSSLTDYTFTSTTPVSGQVSIEFTDPSNGYQIKRIEINPAAATVTDISVEDYTKTVTASTTGTYTFDGKVYAVYSDESKVEIASEDYSVSGTVDLTTAGTYTLTFSAAIDGTTFTKQISISVVSAELDRVVYTLTPKEGSDNGYATSEDITVDGIAWNVTGNSTMVPWRLGGKNLKNVDRALYSKDPISYNISKIEIAPASATLTVNSMTLIVASDASFNTIVSTLPLTFAANSTITVERPAGSDWTGCYYKIVYNVTTGSSNQYVQFAGATFTGK